MRDKADQDCCCQDSRENDARTGRRIEYLSLGWNFAEASIAIVAGLLAGSISLIGFGADSVIESISSAALLWRLQLHIADERRERFALRLVGVSFLILAAYVAVEAARSLIGREAPKSSIAGIVLAALSLVIMPLLARYKRRIGTRLNSKALIADSRQSGLCAFLSAILLGGLALNAALGWWWADPVAALVMVPIIINEGVEALRGERRGDCH